jgi:hypothetical protein
MLLDAKVTFALLGSAGGGGQLGVVIVGGVLALGIAFLPVAALIGSIYGGCAAPSAQEVEDALLRIQRAIAEAELPRGVAEQILEIGRTRTDASLVLVEPGSPLPPCDSRVEVGPVNIVLSGPYNVNPPLRLAVSVTVRVRRSSDGAVLHEITLVRSRPEATEFLEWSKDEAGRLRREFTALPAEIADRVVGELFLLYLLPLDRIWKETP